MLHRVRTTECIRGETSSKRICATVAGPEVQPASAVFLEAVHHSVAMTCAAMFWNGPKANVVTDEHGSALFAAAPSSRPEARTGMQTEDHNHVTLEQSSSSCGLGLTVALRLAFAAWLMSPITERSHIIPV